MRHIPFKASLLVAVLLAVPACIVVPAQPANAPAAVTPAAPVAAPAAVAPAAPVAAPSPVAAPAPVATDNGALKLPGPVVFETGTDQLRPESDQVLVVVKNYLDAKPVLTLLRIEGHTDGDGTIASNETLSEKRALAVAHWLTARGIVCKRLLPVGFGQSRPLADNRTPDGKAQNRRVAFVNAAINGRAIGGLPVEGGGTVAGDACR